MHRLRTLFFSCLLFLPALAFAGPPVDINSANSETLVEGLVGIGPQKAMAIVRHRQQHGPFQRVEDLALVNGIGEKTVERNRGNITLGRLPADAP